MGHLDADRYRCKTSFRVPYRYNDFILTYFAEKFNFNKKEHGLSVVLWGSSNPMKRQAFALLIVLACLREEPSAACSKSGKILEKQLQSPQEPVQWN